MQTIGIRQLTGARLRAAADRSEPLGVTNGGALCAVLLPVTQRWVEQLVEQNFSRLLYGIDLAEKERANREPLVSLAAAQHEPPGPDSRWPPPTGNPTPLRRVGIRELSGDMISKSAERGEALGVTNGGALCAVLLPVTQRWVEQLVEQNLSRLLYNIDLAERDRAAGEPLLDLTEAADDLPDGSRFASARGVSATPRTHREAAGEA
jgi:antitoxin (DNA-binding transcriptional repressor) of toxin-antitoxin stability system